MYSTKNVAGKSILLQNNNNLLFKKIDNNVINVNNFSKQNNNEFEILTTDIDNENSVGEVEELKEDIQKKLDNTVDEMESEASGLFRGVNSKVVGASIAASNSAFTGSILPRIMNFVPGAAKSRVVKQIAQKVQPAVMSAGQSAVISRAATIGVDSLSYGERLLQVWNKPFNSAYMPSVYEGAQAASPFAQKVAQITNDTVGSRLAARNLVNSAKSNAIGSVVSFVVMEGIDIVSNTKKGLDEGKGFFTALKDGFKETDHGKNASSATGAFVGSVVGGFVGSFIPIPGATLVGSVIGGMIGSWAGEKIYDGVKSIDGNLLKESFKDTFDMYKKAGSKLVKGFVGLFT